MIDSAKVMEEVSIFLQECVDKNTNPAFTVQKSEDDFTILLWVKKT